MLRTIFDATRPIVQSASFGQGLIPAPSAPAMAWDREAQTSRSTVSESDRQWWAAESNRPTDAEDYNRRLDEHYAGLFADFVARERMSRGLDS